MQFVKGFFGLFFFLPTTPGTYNCGIICLFTVFGQPVEDVCVAAAVTCRKMVSDSLRFGCYVACQFLLSMI